MTSGRIVFRRVHFLTDLFRCVDPAEQHFRDWQSTEFRAIFIFPAWRVCSRVAFSERFSPSRRAGPRHTPSASARRSLPRAVPRSRSRRDASPRDIAATLAFVRDPRPSPRACSHAHADADGRRSGEIRRDARSPRARRRARRERVGRRASVLVGSAGRGRSRELRSRSARPLPSRATARGAARDRRRIVFFTRRPVPSSRRDAFPSATPTRARSSLSHRSSDPPVRHPLAGVL